MTSSTMSTYKMDNIDLLGHLVSETPDGPGRLDALKRFIKTISWSIRTASSISEGKALLGLERAVKKAIRARGQNGLSEIEKVMEEMFKTLGHERLDFRHH